MIKFFRKIRQNLLSENKFSKYLIYAIGEIVLVMIGILLALQVNNWNEQQKLAKEELNYLKRFIIDLEKDSLYLTKRIERSEEIVANHYTFIHEAYKFQRNKDEFTKLISLNRLDSEHLSMENATYNEMLGAGKFELISDESSKAKILDLYRSYVKVGKHMKEFNEYTVGLLLELTHTTKGLAKYHEDESFQFDQPYMFNDSDWQFINDPTSDEFRLLEEMSSTYASKHRVFIGYFNQLQFEITALCKVLREELKDRT